MFYVWKRETTWHPPSAGFASIILKSVTLSLPYARGFFQARRIPSVSPFKNSQVKCIIRVRFFGSCSFYVPVRLHWNMYLSILDRLTIRIFSPTKLTQSIFLGPKKGAWPVSMQFCPHSYDSCLTINVGLTISASNWAIWPWKVADLWIGLLLNQLFV